MENKLNFFAGKNALSIIKDEGLNLERIKVMAGAAGGPKWLVLYGLDQAINPLFKNRKEPLHLIGSSIGSWRFAAYTSTNSETALEKFKDSYIEQQYLTKPPAQEVTRVSLDILNNYIDDADIEKMLNHPYIRLSIMVVRSRGLIKSDNAIKQALGLFGSVMLNSISRNNQKYFFERALFFDERDTPPFYNMDEFPINRISITKKNFKDAVLASGSIPLVMSGIKNIEGALPGTYRDGGMIDYHLDVPFVNNSDDLVLYPHYTSGIIPGWFDKKHKKRYPSEKNMSNVILVSPSNEFVDSLPYNKIPDRNDFKYFFGKDDQRKDYWNTVVSKSLELGQEFIDVLESNKIKELIKPIKTT